MRFRSAYQMHILAVNNSESMRSARLSDLSDIFVYSFNDALHAMENRLFWCVSVMILTKSKHEPLKTMHVGLWTR